MFLFHHVCVCVQNILNKKFHAVHIVQMVKWLKSMYNNRTYIAKSIIKHRMSNTYTMIEFMRSLQLELQIGNEKQRKVWNERRKRWKNHCVFEYIHKFSTAIPQSTTLHIQQHSKEIIFFLLLFNLCFIPTVISFINSMIRKRFIESMLFACAKSTFNCIVVFG